MKAVLYTHDMEPITILNLDRWAVQFLTLQGQVEFAVMPPIQVAYQPSAIPEMLTISRVRITAEQFIRRGERHLMLFTYDEEQSLLLKSCFLPGQTGALREREREAWGKGFVDALHFAARL